MKNLSIFEPQIEKNTMFIKKHVLDFVKRNVLVEITKEEQESYVSHVNYLTFLDVENPQSA